VRRERGRLVIGTADFERLMDETETAYPPQDDKGAAAWWAERGIDYRALMRWCASEGTDDLKNAIPIALGGFYETGRP
jgi:hypothetical protein